VGSIIQSNRISAEFVSCRGLTYDYETKRAVNDVSFEIARGTVTALVGPNGAGKTTLLRCLAGLEQPVAGAIRIDGADVLRDPRAAHRKLGFLQDFFGLYDGLSVERNLLYAAATQGMPRARLESSVRDAAAATGLGDRLKQPAGELSRGLRQRLAIARTIVHRPALLLLDEPAAGLDPEARMELSATIRSLRQSGVTLIVSSHILSELEQYSTHMLTMRDGRISGPIAVGAIRPDAERVRAIVSGAAAPALRFLEARPGVSAIRDEGDGLSFDLEGGEAERGTLLRAMIDAGIKVTSFTVARADLEALYRRADAGVGGAS
jgi:ABC-2 type transport system ATP-binding protein